MDIEKKLRSEAANLLEGKKVDVVIGYEKADGAVIPCFIERAEDAEQLVWNKKCVHNLAVYLREKKGRAAIVAKGCDARAIVELIKQNQIAREDVFIIGIACSGVEDGSGAGMEKCKNCAYPTPPLYDILLGEKKNGAKTDYSEIEKIESMPLEKRRAFWKKEFEKCIRCYACRNVCPMCYCKECALEDHMWVSRYDEYPNKWMFHMMRAFHLAGRCIDCGECERVCPARIPLRKLYKKIEKDVKELFDYEAGVNPKDMPPLATFDPEKDKKLEK